MNYLRLWALSGLWMLTACSNSDLTHEKCIEHDMLKELKQTFSSKEYLLEFPITVKQEKEVYQDPIWSIKIIEIKLDGEIVQILPSAVSFDYVNLNTQKVKNKKLVYQVSFPHMVFGKISNGNEYEAYKYPAPFEVKLIEVKYSFMYVDGSYSKDCYSLIAKRVDD